jgi:hypothetical protein
VAISYMPKTSIDSGAVKMKVTMFPINKLQFYFQIRVVEFKFPAQKCMMTVEEFQDTTLN